MIKFGRTLGAAGTGHPGCFRSKLPFGVRIRPDVLMMSAGSAGSVNSSPPGAQRRAQGSTMARPINALMPSGQQRICILGGGFGGLTAALKLEGLMWGHGGKPIITLVDQADRFLFKPLLYELVSGEAEEADVAPEIASLLADTSVRFLQDSVAKVEATTSDNGATAHAGKVLFKSGASLEYDWLVVALGALPALGKAKGAETHAIGFASLNDARRVQAAIAALRAAATGPAGSERPVVSIVGAGYAGVELAALIADQLKGTGALVRLLSPSGQLMPGQSPRLVAAAQQQLDKLDVSMSTSKVIEVAEGPAHPSGNSDLGKTVISETGGSHQRERADLVLWTAGQVPATIAAKNQAGILPFPINEHGMLATDAMLRVLDQSRVFAIGDTASSEAPDGAFPATAQVALQQADFVAWNLWASINNRPLLPFKYQHLGTMMTLGSKSGAVELNLPFPRELLSRIRQTPLGTLLAATGVRIGEEDGGLTLEGPLASFTRRAAYVYRQPTGTQLVRVGSSWLSRSLQQVQAALAPGQSR